MSIKEGDGSTRQLNSNLTGKFKPEYSHVRGLKGLITYNLVTSPAILANHAVLMPAFKV